MKIQSAATKALYDFDPKGNGQERHTCPECSHLRKKKSDKCFAWEGLEKRGYCHNCETAFFEYKPFEPKIYVAPEWKNITELTDKAVKWFTGRMIRQETLVKMKVYSDTVYMPQFGKAVESVCFPYFIGGRLVNIKTRGPQKSFKLESGAELVFYNFDAVNSFDSIIICEGEIDALTFIENGIDNVISVPNGANKNPEYLDTCIEAFNHIKRIYLATDQDTKGIELRDELARRLGPERCFIVGFKECKDANEYFIKYADGFKDLIESALPFPVKGIITADSIYSDVRDLFVQGIQKGKEIGFDTDKFITWESGRLAIVTGTPGSGKSELVDFIITKLNIVHGWKAAYFTPENYPLKYHYSKLYEKIIGKKFSSAVSNEIEFDMAFDYIKSNFFYIMNDEDFSVQSILDAGRSLVKSRGIKVMVIDPYNKIEHKYTDSETQYISRFLDQLITFGKLNDILIILVAHPRKMEKDGDGRIKVPSLYDIAGSANFYNKTDYGVTVHRKTDDNKVMLNKVEVYIQKIKFKHLGEQGIVELNYNYVNGRFQKDTYWDNTNWLIRDTKQSNMWEEKDECPF